MSTRIYIGIDPGKSGAISAIWWDGAPVSGFVKLKDTEQDIADWINQFDLRTCKAVIERVASSPQMGVVSAFSFGRSYGFLRGLLCAMRIPVLEVAPVKWQTAMECRTKGDKNVSKAAAQRRWPSLKITHANADSLLLAEYGRKFGWK